MTDEKREKSSEPAWRHSKTLEKELHCSPARISLVYESRDKRFCLFEDADGHLTAVRAARLA